MKKKMNVPFKKPHIATKALKHQKAPKIKNMSRSMT
jgi:hypothetical protein